MSKFKIRHITKYSYQVPVRDSANQIILYPIKDNFQDVLHHHILVSGDVPVETHFDYFGNKVGTFTHSKPHTDLVIDSQVVVVTKPRDLPDDSLPADTQWEEIKKISSQYQFIDFLRHEAVAKSDEIEAVIDPKHQKTQTPLAIAQQLCLYVYKNFTYKKGITTVESTFDEVWKIKTGVCQDFAHVLLSLLRLSDIPARYVSGYICPNKSGMRGEGATHAWVEAYIPFYGWLGFDPTNNCVVNETHVRLAVGRNFSDCSPVKGTYRGTSEHTLEVAVSVSYEDGHIHDSANEVVEQEPVAFSRNSYRRHQEIQMQQ
ncbi:MAG: transglutaminase family protein [Bacteroidetes bacterium]|nr:transglutaminase family protein [Bacteroidota bacterium]